MHWSEAKHPIWQIPTAASGAVVRSTAIPSPTAAVALGAGGVLAMLAPWFVHLAPAASPGLGPVLLPMFYAPLLAALLLRLPLAVAVSALTPFVARLLTGLPADPVLLALVLQIAAFVIALRALQRFHWSFVVPIAYLIGVGSAAIISAVLPGMAVVDFLGTLQTGWPGILVLSVIGTVAHHTLR